MPECFRRFRSQWLWAALCLAATAALLSRPPGLQSDSASYIGFFPERTLLYPLLLSLAKSVSSAETYLAWVARAQGAAIAAAAAFLAVRMRRTLGLSRSWGYALYLLMVLPAIYFAGFILTEPLSYAGLALFWALFLEMHHEPRTGIALKLAVLCAVLFLHRPHLIMLSALLGLWLAWRWLQTRKREFVTGCLALLVCIAAAYGTHGALLKRLTGRDAVQSSIGRHLLVNMLYLSSPADAEIFPDDLRRGLMDRCTAMAAANGWTSAQGGGRIFQAIGGLYIHVVQPELAKVWPDVDEADRSARDMGLVLLRRHWAGYLRLICQKVYYGEPMFYALTALAAALALAHRLRTGARQGEFFVMVACYAALNVVPNLVFNVLDLRYSFLGDLFVLICGAGVGASLLGTVDRAKAGLTPSSRAPGR
jgi:hypothetical protein